MRFNMLERNGSTKFRHRFVSSLLLIGFFGTILGVWTYYSYFVDVGEKGVHEVNSVLVSEPFNVFEPVLPDRSVSLPRDFQFHPEFQHEFWHYFASQKEMMVKSTRFNGASSESRLTNARLRGGKAHRSIFQMS